MRNTQKEQIIAALLSNSDIPRCSRHFAFVPNSDIARMKRSKKKAARWRLFDSNLMIGDAGSQMQIDLQEF
jgi:hypothetical protein